MMGTRKTQGRENGTSPTRQKVVSFVAFALTTVVCLFSLLQYETVYQLLAGEARKVHKVQHRYKASWPLGVQIILRPSPPKSQHNPNTQRESKPLPGRNAHLRLRHRKSKAQNQKQQNSCKWAKYRSWPYTDEFHTLSPYRHKLMYVKTPKSSSSTIAHILQRYTTRQGLVVGYPDFEHDEWTFKTTEMLTEAAERASIGPGQHLDALVSHIFFNSSAVDETLGTKRAFRITSVREPIARSWSMFLHGLERNLSEFSFNATDPWMFAQRLPPNLQTKYARGWGHGFKSENIEQLTNFYDSVVVSDLVLESMVVLAPKLGLKASDLLFMSQKTEIHVKKPGDLVTRDQKRSIDSAIASKSNLDQEFYYSAVRKLNRELALLPWKIKDILHDIGRMTEEVIEACSHILPWDKSCLNRGVVIWDGDQMCVARCIEQWSRTHIECNNTEAQS